MRTFLRDNGLTIALMALFAASMLGMIVRRAGRLQPRASRSWERSS